MAQSTRFGRKIALPSTRQIRHELLVFGAAEDAKAKTVEAEKPKLPAPVLDDARP